jgi:hypothetical protein
VTDLKLGETRSEVATYVGPPSREERFGPKRTPLNWKCRGLVYEVIRVEEEPGNTGDKRVELVFDRQDKLIAIWSNVDGITERGDTMACR